MSKNMMMYDVVVIGGGPGGYVAAIRAAQLGNKTLLIEKDNLGGICLNWGCIPTKALLKSATMYNSVKNLSKYGIEADNISFNWKKIITRSRVTAKRLSKGIEYLMKKNNIDVIKGTAVIEDSKTISLESEKISTKYIILSTGCSPLEFPNVPFDNKRIINYKDAMTLKEIPKSITIIGAGAIGVEFAYFFSSFGSNVTIVESKDRILPSEDYEISRELEKSFKSSKITIETSSLVKSITIDKKVCTNLDGKKIESDLALISIGVTGNYNTVIGDMDIKIKNNHIQTNAYMQTNYGNIYAIGDVSGPPWLAHVASAEGILAVEHLSNKKCTPIDYSSIPGCTYAKPEVASIGLTEDQAVKEGFDIKVGKFPLSASGKAMAISSTTGFAKVVIEKKYGEILGFHMIGEGVTELISEIVLAKSLEATAEDIIRIIHPHPTISEIIPEAFSVSLDEPIHI